MGSSARLYKRFKSVCDGFPLGYLSMRSSNRNDHRARLSATITPFNGFTIVELLMAIVIVVIAILGSAVTFNFAVKSTTQSADKVKIDSLIESDLAKLNAASVNYTYCTGQYTWDGRLCGSASPGQQNYYFPPVTTSSSDADAVAFDSDCKSGAMTADLITAINGGDASLGFSAAAGGLGLSRVAQAEGSAHRIKVTYSLNSNVYRELALIPLAAGWCP
jgi:type II secretory pathway pseudopilin PulG